MKLIKEYSENLTSMITEATAEKGKDYFIEGIFMQADKQNKNGRIYPGSIMESEVGRYNADQVIAGRAVGELGHPDSPTINYERVSHKIISLNVEGSDVLGKAKILNTPYGNIVKSFMDEGIKMGVSSRALGSVVENIYGIQEVQDDFMLATVDIVHDPSAPEAFVQGIMEGREWTVSGGVLVAKAVEIIKEQIKKAPVKSAAQFEREMLNKFYTVMTTLSKV